MIRCNIRETKKAARKTAAAAKTLIPIASMLLTLIISRNSCSSFGKSSISIPSLSYLPVPLNLVLFLDVRERCLKIDYPCRIGEEDMVPKTHAIVERTVRSWLLTAACV